MTLTRRDFLRTAGGSVGVATLGAGVAAGQPSFGGWMEGANNYDGVVDKRGQDTVTVEVGAGPNNIAFGPAAVRIDPGATVEWKWTGKGGAHNVHAVKGASFESDLYTEAGVHFTHTFEGSGIVKYQCDPHAPLGMKGVVVVGDVQVGGGGTPTPTSTPGGGTPTQGGGAVETITGSTVPAFGGWLENANAYGGGVVDYRGRDSVTVEVGAGQTNLAFVPPAIWVDPGTTVKWKWTGKGGSHNVHAVKGASFQSDLYSKPGVHFTHTFEESGIVKYQCDPHAAIGMKGAVAVGDVPTGGTKQAGGGGGLALPTNALGSTLLATTFGVAGVAALLVLGEEYGPEALRRARGENRPGEIDLTDEQREALQQGETVEAVTEDGDRVTIRPSE